MSDVRFNGQERLDEWSDHGIFPKIHDYIYEAAMMELPLPSAATRVADLCCSTGLLGARMRSSGYKVAFLEADTDAIVRGRAAGTFAEDPLREGFIDEDTIKDTGSWLSGNEVDIILARRCLCVLSERVPLPVVAEVFAEAGVTAILLEGQKILSTSVHPFGSADAQAEGLSSHYDVVTRCSQTILYLEAK